MQFLSSTGRVNSTTWMHHIDADSVFRERAVQPPTYYL